MFASPPYTYCPTGAWTTIYRSSVLPFGIISISEKDGPPGGPFNYKLIFVTPPYYYEGELSEAGCGLPTGPTPWAELSVKPKRTGMYLRANGF